MNVLSILASRGRSWSVLISERTDPRYHRVGRLWTRLRRIWYPQADGLIVQTRDVASFMRPMMQDKPVTVIPNGVAAGIGQRAMFDREFLVLGVGRLSPEKRFDRLIQAFADAALDQQTAGPIANNASSRLQRGEGLQEAAEERPAQPQWRLVILGEGPQRSQLEQLVQSLGMNDRVALPGFVQSTTDWLQRCSVFVLTSRYEGFPNALLEAMANGCAVIANDCPSGPAEIVRDNVDGWLVAADDMPQLVTRLRAAMASLDERSRVARRAVEVSQRFSLEACFAAWDEVVDEAIRQSDAQRER
jgi:GalNAc-alpha-(1->4)-GalNAc-alpha-(1->3)-diNAcBac-PP-undecaprenol alpha-1,4-N-acetyl-D-galactosaminyltransferase